MSAFASNPQILGRQVYGNREQQQLSLCCVGNNNVKPSNFFGEKNFRVYKNEGTWKKKKKGVKREYYHWRVEALWSNLSSRPSTVEMEPIADVDQLDGALSQAHHLSQPIIIDWMASWCRKCIYLKPKLEKLAAEYDTKIKFYCVDVNKVSQALVKRGNISKMPTIQLWKDGEMKAEVIGGHKGWLVIEEVREMISNYV